jgi:hypothetical protein
MKDQGTPLFRCGTCGRVVLQNHVCNQQRLAWQTKFRSRGGVPVVEQFSLDQRPSQLVIRRDSAIATDQLKTRAEKLQKEQERISKAEADFPLLEPGAQEQKGLERIDVEMTPASETQGASEVTVVSTAPDFH